MTTHSKLVYILLRVIVCIYTDGLLVHLHPALISMSNAGMVRGAQLTPGPHCTNHRDGIIDTFQKWTGQICRVRPWRARPGYSSKLWKILSILNEKQGVGEKRIRYSDSLLARRFGV